MPVVWFITAERGGVARAKGVEEKEKESTSECKSQRRLDDGPQGHLIKGSGREEIMRKGGGEELVAAIEQFRISRGEKSTRIGLVALAVGPVLIRMRVSKEQASKASVVGAQSLKHAVSQSSEDRAGRRALGSVWWR
jgi:hypothetical protein